MAKETISVQGMTCDHCKMAVEKAIKKVDGTVSVVVDRPGGSAQIEWDESKASRDQYVTAIVDAGYKAH